MTLHEFQAYHNDRYAWLMVLTAYDAMYHSFYSNSQCESLVRMKWGFPPRRLKP